MNEQKHTDGPWKLLKNEDSEQYTVTTVEGEPGFHRCIATVEFGFSEPAESEQHANARLIAAAPELLSVLTELERAVSAKFAHEIGGAVPPSLRDINEQVMKARAVIVKATS